MGVGVFRSSEHFFSEKKERKKILHTCSDQESVVRVKGGTNPKDESSGTEWSVPERSWGQSSNRKWNSFFLFFCHGKRHK